jgi:hypothetical protein
MEQAPGVGQPPHGPAARGAGADVARGENAENLVPSSAESHLGQCGSAEPDDNTSASNSWWHFWQTYSKIGMGLQLRRKILL